MELYHFPADLAQFIDEVAGEAAADTASLARSVMKLSAAFLGRADWQAAYARQPALRDAYLRYYLPANLPKVQIPLAAWSSSDRQRMAGRALRVLDLGSGPGSALLGLLDFVRKLPAAERPTAIELVALDQSFETLRDAERLVTRVAGTLPDLPVAFRPVRLDLVSERAAVFPLAAAGGRFDLVIASNLLSEITRSGPGGIDSSTALLVGAVEQLLSPSGAIIVVEPGSREIARDLHAIRDRLLVAGSLHALAPCLHDLPCPALKTDRDWCIHDLAWEPPPTVRAVDRLTGLDKSSLKFAYLLLAREPAAASVAGEWRVVSDVLDLKGERRVYLCADGRWIVLGQLKRAERSEAAGVFAGLARGDRIVVSGMEVRGALHRLPVSGSIRKLSERLDVTSSPIADPLPPG